MSQKRFRPEEIIAKLREAQVLPGQSQKVPEVVKALGVSEVRQLPLIAKSVGASTSPRPSASRVWNAGTPDCGKRRECIEAVCEGLHVSERRACKVLSANTVPANVSAAGASR